METRGFKKASIKDVAKLAAVSVTTVSHVVSGAKGYSPETVKRVRDAIQELNYVPSYVAKGLRQKSTRTFGVCATDPFEPEGRDLGSYSDRLWAGILQAADENQYKVMHFPRSVRESQDAAEFLNGQIDGLLICASPADRRPALVAHAGLPVVMIGRRFDIPEGVGAVSANEARAIEVGLRHLVQLGHRNIAFVAGPAYEIEAQPAVIASFDDVAKQRLDRYRSWLEEELPDVRPRWITTPTWARMPLEAEIRAWFETDPPTAIFAANDGLARSAADAVAALGLRVPEDVSILGIDNDRNALSGHPAITSIDLPIHQLGIAAVNVLLNAARGGTLEPLSIDLTDLVVTLRESTGPCPPVRRVTG